MRQYDSYEDALLAVKEDGFIETGDSNEGTSGFSFAPTVYFRKANTCLEVVWASGRGAVWEIST